MILEIKNKSDLVLSIEISEYVILLVFPLMHLLIFQNLHYSIIN